MLADLIFQLRQSLGILHKQDIQAVSRFDLGSRSWQSGIKEQPLALPENPKPETSTPPLKIRLGDDCAAIPDGDRYLLLAAEGMLPQFVEDDPWFAGWCAVMVNVSDIYAMGGRPIAVVDTLWSQSAAASQLLLEGMQAAAIAYNVPIVGGHTNCHSAYNALSVAILGQATQLITSFDAQLGDCLMVAVDLQGSAHSSYQFWNAATETDPVRLRTNLELLPQIAESGLCEAGKDISMGGVLGTSLMLLETSGCGALIDLSAIPRPKSVSLERWLVSFPSYGFLLSVRPENVETVQTLFKQQRLACSVVGEITSSRQLHLQHNGETLPFWDLAQEPLTGFSPQKVAK
ncbi:sll0787 family AIR synthase-like protein [Phormidium sp. CLA17]|uniref:sll0787 family AIR synthase-like protein n=1 Tax=Leptolyngbya sp. Cla-17 TaxID=2803751 RepID=UPI00149194AD|nr:sll0787 family AIR synthase-like protein [Leptolyngbya sp. Cla-17]MBM0741523.1 sll0787 family AIR synthase-like protein [Leptolyngbya sp. Cla-17]